MKKALLVGATGLTGSFCLKEILNTDFFDSVEIWVRKSSGIKHDKLIEKVINFDDISSSDVIDATHVFCCLGTTIKAAGSKEEFRKVDFHYVTEVAQLSEKSGCSFLCFISSIGANAGSPFFYLKTKGEAEQFIMKLSIPSIYILRPSFLIGKRIKLRPAEVISGFFLNVFGIFLLGSLRKYKGIKAKHVAIAMYRYSCSPENGIHIIESDKI